MEAPQNRAGVPMLRSNHDGAQRRALCLRLAVAVLTLVPAVAAAQACVGNCGGDGPIINQDVIVGIGVALGSALPSQCLGLDADHNGRLTIEELVRGVGSVLDVCGYQPPEGIVLQGSPWSPAVGAIATVPPVAVDAAEIEDGVILTRLDLHLVPGATVAQINAALQSVNGGIVSMMHGQPTLTIAIPRPTDLDA